MKFNLNTGADEFSAIFESDFKNFFIEFSVNKVVALGLKDGTPNTIAISLLDSACSPTCSVSGTEKVKDSTGSIFAAVGLFANSFNTVFALVYDYPNSQYFSLQLDQTQLTVLTFQTFNSFGSNTHQVITSAFRDGYWRTGGSSS